MADVLCVYREVELLKQFGSTLERESAPLAIISYDEKPGIQSIGTTTLDLPPEPLRHGYLTRDHKYARHGTLSLLAGIDLVTGAVHASVGEGHRSREFIGFCKSSTLRILVSGNQADPRQSFSAHLQGDQGLTHRAARGTFHLRVLEALLMAQSRRGFFLQARTIGASIYPRRVHLSDGHVAFAWRSPPLQHEHDPQPRSFAPVVRQRDNATLSTRPTSDAALDVVAQDWIDLVLPTSVVEDAVMA